ncbi:MAG: ATPase, T2SS/T4P/T4SS family [Kiritimatiellae bacterium]|nr:ATPase, T2SS/T4P/T4SS family [Kiritimatiellia bacterium]MDD5521933.1 ATPase, T2SS/T4P/T4SS family [Kiritimatiellia bacterium]
MQKLEKVLLERNLLGKDRLSEALEISKKTFKPLQDVLVERGFVNERELLKVLAELHGLEFMDLKKTVIDMTAVKSVSAKLASHYRIMPVKLSSGVLTIAVSSSLNMSAVEDIQANLGFHVDRVLACQNDIVDALRKYYGVGADTVERILTESPDREETEVLDVSHDLEKMAEDASVVKLVNQIFQEAINDRATDIHFEVQREDIVVRRRIDGILYDTYLPKNIRFLYPAMVSRIKLMSGLDIVERRLPQDGRCRVNIGRQEYDLRISIVPAIHGEDIVVRILPTSMLFDLSDLGLSSDHRDALEKLIARPHGIIFVTGPTGSGKSTTLYACLNKLNTRDRKIITIEDPVEYELKGITQTQINHKIGLNFARALRSMLRHDPDVMMVGEVRDRETAEIAVQTAMTGHLVLSTLHTNDAAGGAVRLIDMGIDPYLIASTVLAFTAQRLVRVICTDCRESYEAEGRQMYRGRGCANCRNSGYHGRVAISEIMPLESEIQAMILAKSSAKLIRDKADMLGMRTLYHDGWDKVAQGVTTAEEVLRVTSL